MLVVSLQNDFKTQELPLARIKKIMKLDEDVKVGSHACHDSHTRVMFNVRPVLY